MPFQLPPNDEVLTAGAFNDQVSDTTPVLPATRPHTWTQVRTAHPCRTNASAGMSDAVRSQDQVHSDFMKSREAYLQSEATTKDWTHKRTKQRYSRKKAEPSTKAAPNNSKTCGPNPYEVGSKEWLEEFDRRMGIKGLPLPDRPKDQEVRGETYHEWHARYGGKTEWDPMAFCTVEPDPVALFDSELAWNGDEVENLFPGVDMSSINQWLAHRDTGESDVEPQVSSELALDEGESDNPLAEESNEAGWILNQYLKEQGLAK